MLEPFRSSFGLSVAAHIDDLWDHLARSPHEVCAGSSELALSRPYVIPGGRFREIYYWDSYYTMIGLRSAGRRDLLEGLIDNFTDLVERYGRVPNGTRTYYLSRSQPPHFALMVDLLTPSNEGVAVRRLAAMRLEHDFWMVGSVGLAPGTASCRVMRLPDGALLNRYWDERDTPRDESMFEDLLVAEHSGRPTSEVCRDLRAAAESGWDFSSRWFSPGGGLESTRTTRIIPIDLNSLLYATEKVIARHCVLLGRQAEADHYNALACERRGAIHRWLWSSDEQRFGDFDWEADKFTASIDAAAAYTLFAEVATGQQAAATARLIRHRLLAPGGIRTTLVATAEQWDAPNGWAPLQWAAISGLLRYGYGELAKQVAARWVTTVNTEYARSGRLLEKYNIEEHLPGGGGEYPLQDGFGWTNGVTAAILCLYPELDRTPA